MIPSRPKTVLNQGTPAYGIIMLRISRDHHFKVRNRAGDPVAEAGVRTCNLRKRARHFRQLEAGRRQGLRVANRVLAGVGTAADFKLHSDLFFRTKGKLRIPALIQMPLPQSASLRMQVWRTTRSSPSYDRMTELPLI